MSRAIDLSLLDNVLLSDFSLLNKKAKQIARRSHEGLPTDQMEADWHRRLQRSIGVTSARKNISLHLDIPKQLPIAAQEKVIANAISQHQVVIIAGETGSGKTTQIPKICLSLGRGIRGRIGHTQPRRLAAKTVAYRIAEELRQPLGTAVGYRVRFDERFSDASRLAILTDGLLLSQLQRDPLLKEYDTLIIDEAHERSLNIDFLLGCLRKILLQRSDLKLIVTSATVDIENFYNFFSKEQHELPALNVSEPIAVPGRRFDIDIRYIEIDKESDDEVANLPLTQTEQWALAFESVLDDIERYERSSHDKNISVRDILFFLPGEREIREIRKQISGRLQHLEVFPLYSRLNKRDQERVFVNVLVDRPRRVILATNIAETSLTVPGIRYVVDTGLVRVSRFDPRRKIQCLQSEFIAQASADQRAGRCGRLAPGICYRLYAQADFEQLPKYSEPELLRTNLASVVLQMKALRLGEIHRFPFLGAPDTSLLRGAIKSLQELSALNEMQEITKQGRWMAQLPIDPHLARMLWEAKARGVLSLLTVIVSGLVAPEISEYSRDDEKQKNNKLVSGQSEKNAPLQSEFIEILFRWQMLESKRQDLSKAAFRRFCKKEGLSLPRLQEWHDLHRQLLLTLRGLGEQIGPIKDGIDCKKDISSIHIALISGLLRYVARKEKRGSYRAAANQVFFIHPSSNLFSSGATWIVAAQIQETSKVYARTIADIEPRWIMEAGRQHLKYRYASPFWHKKNGRVMCNRTTTLWGLVLEAERVVSYDRYAPVHARQIFIEEALVARKTDFSLPFWQHNAAMIEQAKVLEAKCRSPLTGLDVGHLYDFYEGKIPSHVNSHCSFIDWYKKSTESQRNALKLTSAILWKDELQNELAQQFPDEIQAGRLTLPIHYYFEPGAERDGITVVVKQAQLPQLVQAELDWHVPGLLREKCIEMIKCLPKAIRRQLVPIPALVDQIDLTKPDRAESLLAYLAKQIDLHRGLTVDLNEWNNVLIDKLSDYYRMRIEVRDAKGSVIATARDVELVRTQCENNLPDVDNQRDLGLPRNIRRWDFGDLPEFKTVTEQGVDLDLCPCLVLSADGEINYTLEYDERFARYASFRAITRLLIMGQPDKERYLKKSLFKDERRLLPLVNVSDRISLITDTISGAVIHAGFSIDRLPRDKASFEQLSQSVCANWVAAAQEIELLVLQLIDVYQVVMKALAERRPYFGDVCRNIDQQLSRLVYPGFVEKTPYEQLTELPRYLRGIYIRLEKLSGSSEKDREFYRQIEAAAEPFYKLIYHYPYAVAIDEYVQNFFWILEEWRISLFAQQLGTAVPVSQKRVQKAWTLIDLTQYPESQLIS